MSKSTNPVTQSEESTATKVWIDERRAAIRANVLAALGSPADLLRVSVTPLWGDNFRVNVWADGSNGAAIPNSYFVTADGQGAITKSEPPIEKQY